MFPGEMVDCSQDPEERPLRTRSGILNVIMHNVGLMVSPIHRRSFLPLEMFVAHGWPVDELSIAASLTATTFSRRRPAGSLAIPFSRSRRSLAMQCGNGQHVNTIGGITCFVLLKFYTLGDDVAASNNFHQEDAPAAPAESSHDRFLQAFQRQGHPRPRML